jgi:hypothetical protein
MVARCRPEPGRLVVAFERDGDEPIRLEAADGRTALGRAVGILLARRALLPGDRLTVKPAK